MNINLNLYKYFYNVAYYGSYTKAAESLMISQPSLSYSVKVLENQLNKQLFVRKTKGITLTKYGEMLYNKLDKVFKELESINDDNNDVKGNIILGVRSAFAYKVLPFYISELNKIYPDLNVDFVVATHDRLVELSVNDEVDLVIDEYPYDNKHISLKLEYNYENVFFTTKKKALEINMITKEILSKSTLCLVKNNNISKEFVKMYSDLNYVYTQSTPILLNKIKSNNYIGLSPLVLVSDEIKSGDLVKIESDISLPKLNIYLAYKKNNKDKNVKAITEFFKTHFGNFEQSLYD